ncbi:hypothetical protein COO91_00529 [Nostoc flagelliforme CCNUN1]|uniref:Uncharacterized protein n=1 Tax=Nostoc flagelliforme CCNUN1 TaxID=2038116 RepID=A0A2K8SH64_9NOSO|nr:hypothetical protein COO91_00529 [Nostoc flagelliforme CCNUN1]
MRGYGIWIVTQLNPLSAFTVIVSDYVLTYQMLVRRKKSLGIGHGAN